MLTGAYLNPFFVAMSRNLRKRSAKWRKEPEKGQNNFAIFGGSITYPQNEVAFSAFFGFALPGAPAGSDKNTVSGAVLSLAVSGFFGSSRWSLFCQFFFGGVPGGGCVPVCQMQKHKKQEQTQQSEQGKKKKKKQEEDS